MGQNDIGIDLMESGNQGFNQLSLILEQVDCGIFLLLKSLLQIERPRLLVELSHHREARHFCAICGAILVYLRMHQA